MQIKFIKKRYYSLFIILFLILLSISVYGYMFNSNPMNENNCCDDGKAVILLATNGAEGFGHISLLFKEKDDWYYFSWQTIKVVFTKVPKEALNTFYDFNDWIDKNNSIQNYIHQFDKAIYFCGNFSESIKYADKIFKNYINLQNPDLKIIKLYEKNLEYNRFTNNCVHVSHEILKKGKFCNDIKFKENQKRINLIPKIAIKQYKSKINYQYLFN